MVIASAAKQSMGWRRKNGLLRRFAQLRKRFAFVAGNDEENPGSFGRALRSAPFRDNLRRLCGRGLSSGTSPERIAPESLTHLHSGFVHRNISR
jgi:hypothetical protein